MQLTRKLVLAASAITLVGSFGVASSVQAKTDHCEAGLGKIELDDAGSSVQTDLAPGTEVCIKAGTQTQVTTVGDDGSISNTTIKNRNGKFLGISYYVWYDEPSTPS